MGKLIFEKHCLISESCEVIRIDSEAAKIIRQIQRETGMSARFIASEIIKYAEDKYEVRKV